MREAWRPDGQDGQTIESVGEEEYQQALSGLKAFRLSNFDHVRTLEEITPPVLQVSAHLRKIIIYKGERYLVTYEEEDETGLHFKQELVDYSLTFPSDERMTLSLGEEWRRLGLDPILMIRQRDQMISDERITPIRRRLLEGGYLISLPFQKATDRVSDPEISAAIYRGGTIKGVAPMIEPNNASRQREYIAILQDAVGIILTGLPSLNVTESYEGLSEPSDEIDLGNIAVFINGLGNKR